MERASRLRKLRDEAIRTNATDATVELLNSIWQLSAGAVSVPDYSSAIISLLRDQSSKYETDLLHDYYSFISLSVVLPVCRILVGYHCSNLN